MKNLNEPGHWVDEESITMTKDELTQKITEGILDFIDERVEDGTISKTTGKKLQDRFANL